MRQASPIGLLGGKINHTTTMTILVVVVCLAIGAVSWVFFQNVGEIYIGATERTILEVKERFLKSTLSNIVREMDLIREAEEFGYQQLIDDRLHVVEYGSELTEDQFIAFFAYLFDSTHDWTALLIDQVSGQVLYHRGGPLGRDLVGDLFYYKTFEHENLLGLWGVSRVLVEETAQSKIRERFDGLTFANGAQVHIFDALHGQGEPKDGVITASAFYEDYGWIIALEYPAQTGLDGEKLSFLLSLRLVLLLVLLVILALGVVLIVEYLYFRRTTEQLEIEASEDLLTGAYTRRAGTELLMEAFATYQAGQMDTAFLMLDVDHLKQINDFYGHSGGDQVLKGIVAAARRALGSSAKIIRWGGDEFILILSNVDKRSMQALCTKLVRSISALEFKYGKDIIKPTISVGAAFLRLADQSFVEAVNRADQALYQAKRAGKNRCEVYQESTGEY